MIDYNKIINEITKDMKPSGIRKFFDVANSMKGVISLGVGEPSFQTPWAIRSAAITSLERGKTFYTANSGLSLLREKIAEYFKKTIGNEYHPEDEIIVTVGGSEALDIAIRACVQESDEVIVVEPSFVCYKPLINLACGKAVVIETKEEDNFKLTADALKKTITDKTKMLVLPFPNNPTGAIMTKEELEPIAEVLRDTNILVVSDEIYSELTYDAKHYSISQCDGMKERTIVVNGFSKSFAMTGWRLGFLAGPKPIVSQMLKIHQYAIMASPTVSQYAAIEALTSCESQVKMMVEEYNMRRRYVVDGFNKLGLKCFEPKGAFYVFPSIKSTGLTSKDFCERLLYDKKVAVVPGDAFGDCGDGFIRVSYAYSLDHLKTALKKIKEFLEEIK